MVFDAMAMPIGCLGSLATSVIFMVLYSLCATLTDLWIQSVQYKKSPCMAIANM